MLVIEWKGMHRWAVADDDFNFQLWLHDNGDVSAHYASMTANATHYDTLFSFLMVAGNAQSAGHYIDRVMLDGEWNAPEIVTENTFPPFGYLFQGNIGAHLSGVPDSGLLLTYKRPPLPCPNPMNISVRAMDDVSVTVGWNASTPATGGSVAYMVEYDTVAFTPGAGVHNTAVVSDTTITLTSLAPYRHYWFYVSAQCSSDTSRWRSLEFDTPCGSMTHADLPYAFPTGGNTLPACWRKLGHISVTTTSTGTQLYVQHDSLSVAIFPLMDWLNDLRLDFDHTWNPVTVGVMTNPTDISTFTAVAEIPYENTVTSHTVSLRRYSGAGRYVALRGHDGSMGCNLRNVLLYAFTGCQPVEDLAVAALTPTSADLVWSDPDLTGNYRVVWWTDGVAPDSLTVTDTMVTLTSLMVDTEYTAVVRTLCADSTVGPADTVHFVPGCTVVSDVAADSLTGYAARLRWHDDYGGGTYFIKLYNADTTLLQQDTVVGATSALVAGLAPRTMYLASVSRLCPSGWTDEIFGSFITDYGCAAPDSVTVSGVTDSSATLTIHDATGSGPYVLTVTCVDHTDTLLVDTSVVAITGLGASSRYEIGVSSLCSDSTWSAAVPLVFETQCAVILHTDLPYVQTFDQCTSGDRSTLPPCWTFYDFRPSNYVPSYRPDSQQHCGATGLSFYISPSSNAEPGFIVLPEVDSLSDLVLNFWVNCFGRPGDDRVDVGVMTDPTDTATFTSLSSYTPAVRNEWVQVEVPLGSYTGIGRYPALRCGVNGTTFGDPLYFDDITLRVNLACERPDSLYISNLTATSATLNIDPSDIGDTSAYYQVVVSSYRGVDTILLSAANYQLHALHPATDYSVTVRSVCVDGNLTLPTTTQFSTLCGPYSLPWFDDFEHHDYFQLARCWEVLDSTSPVPVVRWVRPLPYSGENEMQVSLRDSGSFSKFATPELAPYDGPVELSVMVKMYDYAILVDTMLCNLQISLQHGDSLTLLYTVKAIFADWTPVEVVAPMGMLVDGGRFVFNFDRVRDTSWSTALLELDDISVVPACLPVENLSVFSVDTIPEGLEAHWYPQGLESEWEVSIGSQTGTVATLVVYTPMCALTGNGLLADSTDYFIAVRPVCGEGDTGAWSDTAHFRTPDPYHPEGIQQPAASYQLFTVSPNPASGVAVVRCEGATGEWRLSVIDAAGREAASVVGHGREARIDCSRLPAGVYFLRLGGTHAVGKLVVR